ncbi:MAG TPA: DinB family protein [Terracidiphilus sp.]|nr:DinB family protein [Terracidiphilus sp.]
MPTQTGQQFRAGLAAVGQALNSVPAELADVPWREGGWTRKQIVGHLLDSATNNRQRFVRAASGGEYRGPNYAQDGWVQAHGYADQQWEKLLEWWRVEHEILTAVVDRIPGERLEVLCSIHDEPPVTLKFLIDDYVAHQEHHLKQIRSGLAQP